MARLRNPLANLKAAQRSFMVESYTVSIRMVQILDGYLVESTLTGADSRFKTFHAVSRVSLATLKPQFALTLDSLSENAILNRLSPETQLTLLGKLHSLKRSPELGTFIRSMRPHFLVALMNLSMMIPLARLKISHFETSQKEQTTVLTTIWVPE